MSAEWNGRSLIYRSNWFHSRTKQRSFRISVTMNTEHNETKLSQNSENSCSFHLPYQVVYPNNKATGRKIAGKCFLTTNILSGVKKFSPPSLMNSALCYSRVDCSYIRLQISHSTGFFFRSTRLLIVMAGNIRLSKSRHWATPKKGVRWKVCL